MNAATGLSGSGPAYIYTIIEAFAEAGVAAGLPYEIALKSATQTVLGSAKMVQQAGESPATLKARVMSPNGTTVAGNTALENGGIRDVIKSAVIAATNRAEELGRNS
jgi:pyrroline-5-carboxylate reductase